LIKALQLPATGERVFLGDHAIISPAVFNAGRHESLLAESGLYARLAALQFSA